MDRPVASLLLKTAAGTAGTVCLCPPNATDKWHILAINYVPNAATPTDGSNYATVRPYFNQGTSTPIAAARTTNSSGGSAFTAHTAENVTLTGTPTQLEITQADPLHVDVAHTGTGAAVDLQIQVEYEKVR
jgi:hypothetical protein